VEEDYGMKYAGTFLLTLLFALSVKTGAQNNPFSKGGQGPGSVVVIPGQSMTPCPDYKIVIITPSKDVDFKMEVNTPSKSIDPGIIFKPCEESGQLAFAPQVVKPNQEQTITLDQETKDFLKRRLSVSNKNK
jgi:hypothetical protein